MSDQQKIETLTPEQEKDLEKWFQHYDAVQVSTEPSDRPRAEAAMIKLYKRMNLAAPQFMWYDSPMAAVDYIFKETGERVQLTGVDGQCDAYWVAFYTFAEHIGVDLGKDDSEQLQEWKDLAESTGPCYPYTNICIMTERPKEIHRRPDGITHNDRGLAILYRDGEGVAVVNGVEIPNHKTVLAPETLTAEDIIAEDNAEARRIMIEQMDKYGPVRYLEAIKAEIIDTDVFRPNPSSEESCIRSLMKDRFGQLWLVATDGSTPRAYTMPVPDFVKTCVEAHNAISALDSANCVSES